MADVSGRTIFPRGLADLGWHHTMEYDEGLLTADCTLNNRALFAHESAVPDGGHGLWTTAPIAMKEPIIGMNCLIMTKLKMYTIISLLHPKPLGGVQIKI